MLKKIIKKNSSRLAAGASMHGDFQEEGAFISLLPFYVSPTSFLVADKLPCHAAEIKSMPIQYVLTMLNRKKWVEGLYVKEHELPRIKRYKNAKGGYKNDFDEIQFLTWVKIVETNTAICEMENKKVGKGVFVPPGKKLPKGTFIPSSGIIKLDPTQEEFETKNHCSALQDLNSQKRTIYGFIDPEKQGGLLDLINHGPNKEELANFIFENAAIKKNVATSNLICTIKFYNGYAIMGVEALQDIEGGTYGKQLLWSYAQIDEYFPDQLFKLDQPLLLLFDNRDEHNGEIIHINNYRLKEITLFLDTGEIMLQNITSLTRWELMEQDPNSTFVFSIKDSYSIDQSENREASILYGILQNYLKENPEADRVIIKARP